MAAWVVGEEDEKGGHKERKGKKELEESCREMRQRHRGRDVDGKIQPCSSVGGLRHSNALSE